ncbi:N-acetylmuramoyl-L-alanine amidase [Bacillus mesophilus]|uniref:N-acetylmuramoyl-L-alanine amidase CwlD n=1 Tax=Bacillus mesophilus TaxID=1808955 RepID=A0A6M0QCE7_9BACI|nr:N-acetylmuramoyl-L-alanine amidase CwlD [Bacillus mesophilus]MBM7663325.1 N-acetylmuramoyl-L-alanine amidase [Bacillus mesophilus]NEY73976.1 N-acetylmuramoyl-L-alanine amidase CwlD [Bacillus mesophilus]
MGKKKAQIIGVGIGILAFILIIQNQLTSNDSWNTWNLPLSGEVIVLDPGHGGIDGGASYGDEVFERDIALDIVLKVKDYLQEQGALVLMTREDHNDIADPDTKGVRNRKVEDLKNRVKFINGSDASSFITIHLNAIPAERWRGAQTFYYGSLEENKRLATFVQAEIKRNLENTNRSAKAISGIYLLKKAQIPGALVEVGFLSNPHERNLLTTEEYQEKMAASIYKGILRYYSNELDLPN